MPTRKQRKRRAKEKRHSYEYVYVDADGQEVEVDEEPTPSKPGRKGGGVRPNPSQTRAPSKGAVKNKQASTWREVKPPSWSRVGRRGLIFAPIMVVVVYLLKPSNATPASVILQVLVLLGFFLPFSYFMDGVMYRQYRKKIGDPLPPRRPQKD